MVANVAAVRDAVGPNIGIGVDFHGRVHRPMARVLLDALAPYHLMFVEEPVLSEHVDGIADVLRNSTTPIALGERLYSRWDFKNVITTGVVDIIQPDLSHAGGITEVRKIAAMAEAYDIAVAPHCPLGPIACDRSGWMMSTTPVVMTFLKSHREYSRSPSAMGVVEFRSTSAIPSTCSESTGSSTNIRW